MQKVIQEVLKRHEFEKWDLSFLEAFCHFWFLRIRHKVRLQWFSFQKSIWSGDPSTDTLLKNWTHVVTEKVSFNIQQVRVEILFVSGRLSKKNKWKKKNNGFSRTMSKNCQSLSKTKPAGQNFMNLRFLRSLND